MLTGITQVPFYFAYKVEFVEALLTHEKIKYSLILVFKELIYTNCILNNVDNVLCNSYFALQK